VDSPVLVYPPSDTSKPAKLVMLLHGMCGHPENECPWFAGAATSGAYVACPRANLLCNGGGTIWSGASGARARLVSSARDRVEQTFEGAMGAESEATLVGFSLGALVALDVAEHSHGGWKRLLLIGAFVKPNAKKLKEAGVESVLLASGDWDMSRDEMKKQARQLERQGIRARYIGMGPVGHWFAKDMDAWLKDALAWLDRARGRREAK
jgi:predicted esterase